MSNVFTQIERPQDLGFRPAFGGAAVATSGSNQGFTPIAGSSDQISVYPSPLFMQSQSGAGANWLPGGLGGNLPQPIGMIANLIAQLYSMIAQWGQQCFGQPPRASEDSYRDATASSVGDPHLSFNGTRADGTTQNTHFDSMAGHRDLVDSDSFYGGYKVSTKVTAPSANGVTLNQSATITSNFGRSRISMDNTGGAKILQNGIAVSIEAGQTLDLGDGQTISKNGDGSLSVINVDGRGGSIKTTLAVQSGGVNVTTSAHDVDLGGDILGKRAEPPIRRAPLDGFPGGVAEPPIRIVPTPGQYPVPPNELIYVP